MVDHEEHDVSTRHDGTARQLRFDDRGASLVEFALVMPLLVLLLFGIIEFGYLFAQHLDVRHGAREGARMASVAYDPQDWGGISPEAAKHNMRRMIVETCERMDFAEDDTQVTISLVGTTGSVTENNQPGDYLAVEVEADPTQITGLFSTVIDPITLRSEVEMRIERTFEPVAGFESGFSFSRTCAQAAAEVPG